MDNINQNVTKIFVSGMDERSLNALSFFFNKFCQDQCEISEESLAQAFLVNMDSVDSETELARLKQSYPDCSLILTSIKLIEVEDNYFLRKPMIAEHLMAILNNIRSGVPSQAVKKQIEQSKLTDITDVSNPQALSEPAQTKTKELTKAVTDKEMIAFVGEAQDVNLRQLQYNNDLFFDLEQYFLGFLQQAYQQAKQAQCAVKITGLWKPIIIFAESNQVYIEMSDRQLKSICVVSLNSSSIAKDDIKMESLQAQKAAHFCKNNKNYQNLDLFMWKIALWTSRGRLPKSLPLDSPLYLLGWPNLTRLIVTPEALRICSYWVPHPRTIINLTEVVAAPQRYVFSLITATYILGMSDLANRQSDVLILPSGIEPSTKMNLFSRIMKKLKKGM